MQCESLRYCGISIKNMVVFCNAIFRRMRMSEKEKMGSLERKTSAGQNLLGLSEIYTAFGF